MNNSWVSSDGFETMGFLGGGLEESVIKGRGRMRDSER